MRRIFTILMMVLMMVPSLVFSQDITITLDQGWTWISYPRGDTLQLDYALSVITPNQGDIIKSQHAFSIYDTENGWQGSMTEFIPGKGYMYKSSKEESFSFVFPDPVIPVVTTGEVSGITSESAIGGGNVVSSGGKYVTARGLCWSTEENPTIEDRHTVNGDGLREFVGTIDGLLPGKSYYVRAYATNGMGTGYGEQVNFTTIPGLPVVATVAPYNFAGTSVMVGGNVIHDGGYAIQQRGICYSTHENPTTEDITTNNGNGIGSFSQQLSGLTIGTQYYVRAFAVNSQGIGYGQEESFTAAYGLPSLVLDSVTSITHTSATFHGSVSTDGGYAVIVKGFCWATHPQPTATDNVSNNGSGNDTFTHTLTGLTEQTTYYVRPYAFSALGCSYGNETTFTTESAPAYPQGAINGLFSIKNGFQVYISQGNLQYIGSAESPIWKFAEHQWDHFGEDQSGTEAANIDRDLFGWGTSGYHNSTDPYNAFYQPWSTSHSQINPTYNYDGYGPSVNMPSVNLTGSSAGYDWGVFNPISNGGNIAGLWRTMTSNEWWYLFNDRTTVSGMRFAKAQVNGVNGVILFPDNYDALTYIINRVNTTDVPFSTNQISMDDWLNLLEPVGCVFLPVTGYRSGKYVYNSNSYGFYWSSSEMYNSNFHGALGVEFGGSLWPHKFYERYTGGAVRLIRPVLSVSIDTAIVVDEHSVICGSDVFSFDDLGVVTRGVCWSTSANPTIDDNHTNDGLGMGHFDSNITGLEANVIYYIRAYATISNTTIYSDQRKIVTRFPDGLIAGKFTIAQGKQVYFSQGNLQYQASTNIWRLADNQWDYVGANNSNISENYSGWIDLFGWGTSGYNHGATCFQPWTTSTISSDYYVYGSKTCHLYDQTGMADWGYNAISNGGNQENQWRTLTMGEWYYILNTRETASGTRYAKAQVNGINGLILFPDDWEPDIYHLNGLDDNSSSHSLNQINASTWRDVFAAHGCVFMPSSGIRIGTSIYSVGSYWSSSVSATNNYIGVYCLRIAENFVSLNDNERDHGFSVRLVRDCE